MGRSPGPDLDAQDRRAHGERFRPGRQDRGALRAPPAEDASRSRTIGVGALRFAFLDSWLTDRAGGSGTAAAVAGLARALRERGHTVEFERPEAGTAGILRRLWFNVRLPVVFDPDCVDAVVSFDLDGCFLPPSSTPRIASLKGVAADELRFEEGVPRMRLAAQARLERRAAHRADVVVVPSRYSLAVASDAYDLPPERFAVVPEGIDVDAWTSRDRGAARDGRAPVVLSVARQYPRKNTGALLRALPAVRDRIPGARLRVVGGGPRLPALRSLAAELGVDRAVDFLGEIEEPSALRREYARAAVFCLPSRQEGFGIVFLEAMASGLPVVAGDAAAVPEVVPDGEAGLLVPPTEPQAVARALVRLLGDEELRARMGRRGREHVRAFDWDRVAGRFESVVARARADRPPGGGLG